MLPSLRAHQIYRVLSNSPAYKDGRLRKGDRILSVNGLSMRGLTHRESVTVLKTPRLEVVMVVTRSESVRTQATAAAVDAAALAKSKRASLGSLTSLHEKQPLLQQQQQHHQNSGATNGGGVVVGNGTATAAAAHKSEEGARRKMAYHKLSQSLEMDLDMMSNEGTRKWFTYIALLHAHICAIPQMQALRSTTRANRWTVRTTRPAVRWATMPCLAFNRPPCRCARNPAKVREKHANGLRTHL